MIILELGLFQGNLRCFAVNWNMSQNMRFCAIFGAKIFIRAILYIFSISVQNQPKEIHLDQWRLRTLYIAQGKTKNTERSGWIIFHRNQNTVKQTISRISKRKHREFFLLLQDPENLPLPIQTDPGLWGGSRKRADIRWLVQKLKLPRVICVNFLIGEKRQFNY